jgi:hypothetical protein
LAGTVEGVIDVLRYSQVHVVGHRRNINESNTESASAAMTGSIHAGFAFEREKMIIRPLTAGPVPWLEPPMSSVNPLQTSFRRKRAVFQNQVAS